MKSPSIDLLLLCGARPTLLCKTLESFERNVFPHFRISNVYANIDKFQGGEKQVLEVAGLILSRWPQAVIRNPVSPSFTEAVKWLWGSLVSPYGLHLEDDWVSNEPITPDMVFPHFVGNTRQVSILTPEKAWKSTYPFHCAWRRRKFLGIAMGRFLLKDRPLFTTSPSFIEREFAGACAKMMLAELDPEKQMYDGRNPSLSAYTSSYRNRLVTGSCGYLVTDIGRQHHASIGIEKKVIDGRSTWTEKRGIKHDPN